MAADANPILGRHPRHEHQKAPCIFLWGGTLYKCPPLPLTEATASRVLLISWFHVLWFVFLFFYIANDQLYILRLTDVSRLLSAPLLKVNNFWWFNGKLTFVGKFQGFFLYHKGDHKMCFLQTKMNAVHSNGPQADVSRGSRALSRSRAIASACCRSSSALPLPMGSRPL